jgi:N-acyl-L-homoserine lactone synthetase
MTYHHAREEVIKQLVGARRASAMVQSGLGYSIRLVSEEHVLAKLFKFRYDLYCLHDQLLTKSNYPSGVEFDDHDAQAVHFAAFDENGEIVGTMRLIGYTSLGFPTEQEFRISDELVDVKRDRIMEVSRLLARPDYRNSFLLIDLCKTAYLFARNQQNNYLLGCAERSLIKLLHKLLGPIPLLGEPTFCFNAVNHAFLIDIDATVMRLRARSQLQYEYFSTQGPNIRLD